MKLYNRAAAMLLLPLLLITGCMSVPAPEVESSTISAVESAPEDTVPLQPVWTLGYGSVEIPLPDASAGPLYIAGYQNGAEITGTLDLPRVNAVWLEADGQKILLFSVDCVALASDTVAKIRETLSDFRAETGCSFIGVTATHTHAGIDTLGLWGPAGVEGKNASYMENLILSAKEAADIAYESRTEGKLYYSATETNMMEHDSRDPYVFDPNIYQLRFSPADEAKSGIRLLTFGAHAESLRGDNTLLSRDFPGVMCDLIKAETGDDAVFFPGAVGGLIMTRVFCIGEFDAKENLERTGLRMARTVLEADPAAETEVAPTLSYARMEFDVPLDNPLFMAYGALGILGNQLLDGSGASGYDVRSEVAAIALGDVTIVQIPCEIFPELVTGEGLQEGDPEPLFAIAESLGREKVIVMGLSNDELGYVVPPSDFLLNEKAPYVERVKGGGEDHYEETNSVGPLAAPLLAETVRSVLELLK